MPNYIGVSTDDITLSGLTFKDTPVGRLTSIYHVPFVWSPLQVDSGFSSQVALVPGIKAGDAVTLNTPSLVAAQGIYIVNVTSVNNGITVTFNNTTTGALVPISEQTYQIMGVR